MESYDLGIKEEEFLTHTVTSTVFHDGLTNAINVDGHADVELSDKMGLPLAEAGWPMLLRQVIKPEDKPIELNTRFHSFGFKLSPEQVNAINEGKTYVHFFGQIRFQDVFGDRWLLKFRRRWEFRILPLPSGMPRFGVWLKYGPDGENSETHEG